MVGTQLLEEPTVAPNKPRTADSATPLFIAAYQGLTDVVQAFLRADRSDVKIDLGDIHSVTPLCAAAAWSGSAATTQALLSAGADSSRACFATGSPPLFMAAWGGHLAVVEAMLRLDGVDVNQRCGVRCVLQAAVLVEIYLCNVCSCQEILRRNGRG
jgi:ankyrin repeat protein